MGGENNLSANLQSRKSEKLYSVDFLRFVFSVIIVYYHFSHSNMVGYTGGQPLYDKLGENSFGGILVECFFIISGYFLYYTFKNHKDMTFSRFTYSKVARLWPVLFFTIVVETLFFNRSIYDGFFNSLFLQCIGLTTNYKGIAWYVSPLFWSFLFYFGLHKLVKKEKNFCFIIAVIAYFGYAININSQDGGMGREVAFGFLSMGLFRSLAGIAVGYLVATAVNLINENGLTERITNSKSGKAVFFLLCSAVEVASLVMIFLDCFSKKFHSSNDIFIVIMFVALLLSLSFKTGIVSVIINNRFFGFFGRYAYSIYLIQQTVMWTFQKNLWQNTSFVENHALRCIALSLLIIVAAGIAVYYIVEKPCAKLFKIMGKKLFFNK